MKRAEISFNMSNGNEVKFLTSPENAEGIMADFMSDHGTRFIRIDQGKDTLVVDMAQVCYIENVVEEVEDLQCPVW